MAEQAATGRRDVERANMKAVTLLEVDGSHREHTAWSDVELAFRTLDASGRSELVMEAADGSLLTVAGGRRRFHVQYTSPVGSAPSVLVLAEPTRTTEVEELFVGGVRTPLLSRLIVGEATAVRAAAGFHRGEGADSALTWD